MKEENKTLLYYSLYGVVFVLDVVFITYYIYNGMEQRTDIRMKKFYV
jgi:hypothetical protein